VAIADLLLGDQLTPAQPACLPLSDDLLNLETFRRHAPEDSFGGWVRAITANKVRDHWRGALPVILAGDLDKLPPPWRPPGSDDEPSATDGEDSTSSVLHRALQLARSSFEERTWQAFWKVTVQGQRPADVAAELGMSTRAVYIAKSRVLGRLRAEFQDLIE
jgi:RNA polymerase sigma-70 factor (ECF subfamily)